MQFVLYGNVENNENNEIGKTFNESSDENCLMIRKKRMCFPGDIKSPKNFEEANLKIKLLEEVVKVLSTIIKLKYCQTNLLHELNKL